MKICHRNRVYKVVYLFSNCINSSELYSIYLHNFLATESGHSIFYKIACAPVRAFGGHSVSSIGSQASSSGQWRHWLDCEVCRLCWAHMQSCREMLWPSSIAYMYKSSDMYVKWSCHESTVNLWVLQICWCKTYPRFVLLNLKTCHFFFHFLRSFHVLFACSKKHPVKTRHKPEYLATDYICRIYRRLEWSV